MKTQIRNNRPMAMWGAVVITLTCLLVAKPAFAATDTWNGGAVPDGNWLTPGNWNGVTPTTNDLLVFTGGTQTATTNNFSAGTAFNNLSFSSGASPFTLGGNSMVLSSPTDAGSGQIAGGSIISSSSSTNTIRLPVTLATGKHTITGGSGAGLLKLNGTVTHNNGAVAIMSGNINVTGGFVLTNGLLGGWAVYNNNWATLDANNNVTNYTAYTDIAANGTLPNTATANVRIPNNGAATATAALPATVTKINSLFFGSPTASSGNETVTIGAGKSLVLGQNGGIYNNTGVAGAGTYRTLLIGANIGSGGTLTAGDGINPATITFGSAPLPSTGSYLTINSSITDNGPAPVTVVVAGAYMQMNGEGSGLGTLAVTNTYSGGTYILQGRVSQPGSRTFGTGPIYIVSGGQFNTGAQITNEIFVEGSGTTENGGLGAVRIYSAVLGSGVLGNLCGTVHLTGNAAIGGNGNANNGGQPFNGISGKITGPGTLWINSPTGTGGTAGGTINVGSTNALGIIYTNDYAGDTVINGTAGATVNSMLRICLPADNNIMPHGLTGSFTGGKTGNVILNGTASNRQGIFDLNGSTQTINGLSSTVNSPANNFVQDNSGLGATLVVGDSDATSTFAGAIQNGVVVRKIGAGTLTLSGANSYNGDSQVVAGRLVTTTASTGGGNFGVSNNAALGVTVANAGQTLGINNLTFGTGSSLQLNAGSFGNPGAAVLNVGGALTMNANVNISLSGVGLTAGGPFTIMTYAAGSRTGAGNFILANSPRVVGTLSDDTVNGVVSITITSADAGVGWNGGVAGNWDINNTGNTVWQTFPSGTTTYYIEASGGNDVVQFDDTATGTTNVNLTTTLTPQSITVSNSTKNYLFNGPGKLSGSTGLTKNGNGTLTIANSGNNDFSGNIAINQGTLIFSNTSLIGNVFSGNGALTKNGNGTLTLNGDGSGYTGPITVNGGTLSVQNSSSAATASGITVANGATLDIGNNNVGLGHLPITVSGSGVGGNGAIVNSSGYGLGAISTSFQTLTMTGDTTIGGPGRLDFRATTAGSDTDATLSTGGLPYKLTKVSPGLLQLAGVQIDNALGNIDVQGGILSIQGHMPSLGNPANAVTVYGGATLQFVSVANDLTSSSDVNKALVLQDNGIVQNSAGANIFDGPVTLQANGVFNIGGSGLTFTNVIGGPGTLSKVTGNATLTLTASNTYTGNTVVSIGTLTLTEPGDIRTSANIVLGAGTTLDVNGRTDQTLTLLGGHSLTGSGTV
ncbi:MAG TPA: autotransporter-associated beta strand repeat-containing protein, partial [Candidatus Acidoferrales bacterium]|nr:autotransporter-associated beta strand repeat-containing protein [Candidatus Acidoferrales bacterium]